MTAGTKGVKSATQRAALLKLRPGPEAIAEEATLFNRLVGTMHAAPLVAAARALGEVPAVRRVLITQIVQVEGLV